MDQIIQSHICVEKLHWTDREILIYTTYFFFQVASEHMADCRQNLSEGPKKL